MPALCGAAYPPISVQAKMMTLVSILFITVYLIPLPPVFRLNESDFAVSI
jgi:hypothetical protein